MKRYIVVSMGGVSSVGGVERVMYYLDEILEKNNTVIIVDKHIIDREYSITKYIKSSNIFAYAILASHYVSRIRLKEDVIIGNGYNLPFVYKDFLFAHGNIVGFCKKVYNFTNYKLGFLEMVSGMTSKRILAVSEQAKEEWKKYYKIKKKIDIIENAVDCDRFFPKETEDKANFTILYCGRLEKAKGSLRLLELAEYIEHKKNIKLIMAIPNETEEMNLFKKLKNTQIYIGKTIDEMNDFYNQGDIFFFPSRYEGFALVVLESLAAGVPVVANQVSGIKEIEEKVFDGIRSMDEEESIETIMKRMQTFHERYLNIKQRKELHENIRSLYGLEVYKKKIAKIMRIGQ